LTTYRTNNAEYELGTIYVVNASAITSMSTAPECLRVYFSPSLLTQQIARTLHVYATYWGLQLLLMLTTRGGSVETNQSINPISIFIVT